MIEGEFGDASIEDFESFAEDPDRGESELFGGVGIFASKSFVRVVIEREPSNRGRRTRRHHRGESAEESRFAENRRRGQIGDPFGSSVGICATDRHFPFDNE